MDPQKILSGMVIQAVERGKILLADEEFGRAMALLQLALQTSVPLYYLEIQMGAPKPLWDDPKKMQEFQLLLAEHGHALFIRNEKKGRSAKVFNAVAESIANLCQFHGGVTVFGFHWQAPGVSRPKGLGDLPYGDFLYHITWIRNLASIRETQFMVPSIVTRVNWLKKGLSIKGKQFFTEPAGVHVWLSIYADKANLESPHPRDNGMVPVILRIPKPFLPDATIDAQGTKDAGGIPSVQVKRKVPTGTIEVWTGHDWDLLIDVDLAKINLAAMTFPNGKVKDVSNYRLPRGLV